MLTSFHYVFLAAAAIGLLGVGVVSHLLHRRAMVMLQRELATTKALATAMAVQSKTETLRAGLAALEADWCQAAQSHFRTAERQEDEFAKRFCQNGGTCYANCVIGLRELLARVDGAGDLRAQAVEQNAKRQ